MTDSSQPIAGWYPDPENPAGERWWDGAAWSDHRRASTVAPTIAPTPPAAPVPPAEPVASTPVAPAAAEFAAPGASLGGAAPAATPQYGAYAAPAAPAAYNPYGAPAYAPTAPVNSLALVGLILATAGILVSFGGLTPLAGGIVSTIALSRASKMRARGEAGHRWGMALAGTICGYAFFLIILGLIIFAIVFSISQSSSSYRGIS